MRCRICQATHPDLNDLDDYNYGYRDDSDDILDAIAENKRMAAASIELHANDNESAKEVTFYEVSMIECPMCQEDALEYADKFCTNCGQQIPFLFWESWRTNLIDHEGEAAFLSHLASNEIAVCCHDHVDMCYCTSSKALTLDEAELEVKEEGITDDDMWEKECASCSHYASTSCPSYLNWVNEFVNLRKAGRFDKPRAAVPCEDYEMYYEHWDDDNEDEDNESKYWSSAGNDPKA